MFKKRHDPLDSKNKQEMETVIGSSINVKGNFTGRGNIRIEGKISGSVRTKKDIIVSPGSIVEANIYGDNVVVAGQVKGNIRAQGKLDLTKSAQVKGDIETSVLSIEKGAILNGKCTTVVQSENKENDKKEKNDKKASTKKETKESK